VSTPDNVSIVDIPFPRYDKIDHYYLEVRSVQTHELITVIELLSPVNKNDPRGRAEYQQKREEILYSATSYIEIDFLRAGEPLSLHPKMVSDYRILVSRGWKRWKMQLYLFNLPTPIPDIPLPLLPQDTEPLIPLNQILHETYTRARFDLQIDYKNTAVPPLPPAQEEWAQQLIRSAHPPD
jgi:hypothetical protein